MSLNKPSLDADIHSMLFRVLFYCFMCAKFVKPSLKFTYQLNLPNKLFSEMFVRMLSVRCNQNGSYEITMNGFQARKIKEIKNMIFGFHLWEIKYFSWWTSKLRLRKISHSQEPKIMFLILLTFSGLITIHNYYFYILLFLSQ